MVMAIMHNNSNNWIAYGKTKREARESLIRERNALFGERETPESMESRIECFDVRQGVCFCFDKNAGKNREDVCMIKSAQQVWKEQSNRADFEKACDSIMRAVEKASAEGKRQCVFNPNPYDQYRAVQTEFAKHGYIFKPFGYSGGVRQDVDMICW